MHLLQTETWGRFKAEFGWQAQTVATADGRAQVLFRPLPLGRTLAYVPRGPSIDWDNGGAVAALLAALDQVCGTRRAAFLKIEPDLPDEPAAAERLARLGFRPSPHPVQPRRTLVLDLDGSEDDLLARMKQKTRYNLRLARKKGVTARPARAPADLDAFIELTRQTGARDGFGVHSGDYYRRAWQLFHPAGQCELILAELDGQALAGVMAFALGEWAWYFYGASSDRERQRMAPYLAQWTAIRWARGAGARCYDLWGVPDEDEAALEAQFEGRRDGLWGVYRFKRGWGGRLARSIGAWDRAYSPLLYGAYRQYVRWRGANLG